MKSTFNPKLSLSVVLGLSTLAGTAQGIPVSGIVQTGTEPVPYAHIYLPETQQGGTTDSAGLFIIHEVPQGTYQIQVSCLGHITARFDIAVHPGMNDLVFQLAKTSTELDEVVVTGTLREVRRVDSPVPVEIYTPAFFRRNPTPNLYDAFQIVNGVRPQLNCNVCNTGDIHMNGMEGPYTMILIDGMPIVSGLATVYGLSAIPNAMIERIEIVRGPASSLYGSEAVGGLINVITRKAEHAPLLYADVFTTSWHEHNVDLGFNVNAGAGLSILTGINYFRYQRPADRNGDNFTDVTLQDRISVFQKWQVNRPEDRVLTVAGRYLYEDRWGGEMQWTPAHRGGDQVYGESIYTRRWELIGAYRLPAKEHLLMSCSYNDHDQNSVYGTTWFFARQRIAFSQLTWDKSIGNHTLLTGVAMRHTWYDDNTPATAGGDTTMLHTQPQQTWLPGIFVQDEIPLSTRIRLLLGMRYDHHNVHGSIYTPRVAAKWTLGDRSILRLNAGTGFRVVNLFTEDHAALTGAREVVILDDLQPERSYNVNLNFIRKFYATRGTFVEAEASVFYTYFNNRIVGDYESDVEKIIYDNLSGYAENKGISCNVDCTFGNGLKLTAGATFMENTLKENGITTQQILTEKFTGAWALSYHFTRLRLTVDYTGNVYSPMRLPLLGELDPRRAVSPWWSIQNIQLVYHGPGPVELYGGVKNLLDWTPARGNPFLIARAHDPFDTSVMYDAQGTVLSTPENPYALTFDPTYVYAPNQGLRVFLGMRFRLN